METKPIAVVTARGGSIRLPYKNTLPIGDFALFEWSIQHAKNAGLDVIVTSDMEPVLYGSKKMGAITVERPLHLANGKSHYESIKHAISSAAKYDESILSRPVVLLQPTSPFRKCRIIQKCIDEYYKHQGKVIMSGRSFNAADLNGAKIASEFWDGCVAVYPPDKVAPPEGAVLVQNDYGNGLQIDTEQDYIDACVQHWRNSSKVMFFDDKEETDCVGKIREFVGGRRITLVGRPDGKPIDQSHSVAYLNRCQGWDGGRADILFLVGSKDWIKNGINKEVYEVAAKASIIVIRDLGSGEWLSGKLNLPDKTVMLTTLRKAITSGAVASMMLNLAGGIVERVGFQHGVSRIHYMQMQFIKSRVSDELALLEVSGYDR